MTLEQVREIVSEAVAEHRDPNEIEHRSPPSGARATHSASAAALAGKRAILPKLTPALIVDCDEPAAFSRGGGG